MRHLSALTVAAMLACWAGSVQAAEQPTLENTPPVVVKTEPQAGQTDVEPGRKEISVTFSKPMRDWNWSWVEVSKESFPTKTGEPHFLSLSDQRRCVLPVSLESGRTYAIWLNNPPFQNFQDQQGRRAVPYLLVFRTK
jgi:hypothetical protein